MGGLDIFWYIFVVIWLFFPNCNFGVHFFKYFNRCLISRLEIYLHNPKIWNACYNANDKHIGAQNGVQCKIMAKATVTTRRATGKPPQAQYKGTTLRATRRHDATDDARQGVCTKAMERRRPRR